jgi:hypothetical protein
LRQELSRLEKKCSSIASAGSSLSQKEFAQSAAFRIAADKYQCGGILFAMRSGDSFLSAIEKTPRKKLMGILGSFRKSKPLVIALSGAKGSGKTAAAAIIAGNREIKKILEKICFPPPLRIAALSFASPIQSALESLLGKELWSRMAEAKEEIPQGGRISYRSVMLQSAAFFKDLLGSGVFADRLARAVAREEMVFRSPGAYVIDDLRFPEEEELLREKEAAGEWRVIRIHLEGSGRIPPCSPLDEKAESALPLSRGCAVVDNKGSIAQLESALVDLLRRAAAEGCFE